MSLVDDVLNVLIGSPATYRRMREHIMRPGFRRHRETVELKQETLYLTLARLKRNGLVIKKSDEWRITARGRERIESRENRILPYHSGHLPAKTSGHRNMIAAFDIPETSKYKRDWLRYELTLLGFVPIQKSVWYGPAPLPRKFISALGDLNILQHLKFFKAEEWEVV